jgi:IstB-like ATP binding protein
MTAQIITEYMEESFGDRDDFEIARRLGTREWHSVVPSKFHGWTLADVDQPDVVLGPVISWLRGDALGVVLIGPVGAGKTVLAVTSAEIRFISERWCDRCIVDARPGPRIRGCSWCVDAMHAREPVTPYPHKNPELLAESQAYAELVACWLTSTPTTRPKIGTVTFTARTDRPVCPVCGMRATYREVAHYDGCPNSSSARPSPVKFSPVATLLNNLRPGGDGDIADYTRPDVLIIDDIDKFKPTEWSHEVLFEIVNARWLDERSTMCTSNLTMTGLRKTLGEAIVDRLRDDSIVLQLAGPSRRRTAAEREGAA